MVRPTKAKRIRVGQRVLIPFGTREVEAEVIEDRGNLGVGGRQIIRVHPFLEDAGEDFAFELPAEEVTVVGP